MKYLLLISAFFFTLYGVIGEHDTGAKSQIVPPRIKAVAWSPNGNYLATGSVEGIHIYDPQLNEVRYIEVFFNSDFLAWNPDSTQLAFFHGVFDEQAGVNKNLLEIWDVMTSTYAVPAFEVFQPGPLDWNPDGTELAISAFPSQTFTNGAVSVNRDNLIHILNASTGQIIRSFTTDAFDDISSISWSLDGQYLAVAGGKNFIIIWNGNTGEIIKTISTSPRSADLIWSPDSTKLLLSSQAALAIWNIDTEQISVPLDVGSRTVSSLDWKDNLIAAHTFDNSSFYIFVWSASTGQVLITIQPNDPVYAISLSPNGSKLAYGDGEVLQVVPVMGLSCTPMQTVTSSDTTSLINAINRNVSRVCNNSSKKIKEDLARWVD